MSNIQIVLDERFRLVTAVLAASNWPEIEQAQKPHAVHTHTKQTMQFVSEYKTHPAVSFVNEFLANGHSLNTLLDIVLCCEWPSLSIQSTLPDLSNASSWVTSLASFARETNIGEVFWPAHDDVWQTAVSECQTIFEQCTLPDQMAQMSGTQKTVRLMPTLVLPMLDPIIGNTADSTTILLPPPKAWGESPPWPYKEDPIWVVVGAAKGLIADAIQAQVESLTAEQQATIVQAGVALSLEQLFDEFERQAYVIRIRKEESLGDLPKITNQLRDWFEAGATQPLTAVYHTVQ